MARTTEDMKKDKKMLKKISIGDKVKYISKTGEVKTGIVSKVTEYKGRLKIRTAPLARVRIKQPSFFVCKLCRFFASYDAALEYCL